MGKNSLGCFQKPASQDRMIEIGSRLAQIRNSKSIRHRRSTKSPQLRKDEPHPVAALMTKTKLVQGIAINGRLRGNKTSQIISHARKLGRAQIGGKRWRGQTRPASAQRSPSRTGSTDSDRFRARRENVERVCRMLPIL